jgi:hypothetical protein
MSPWGEEAAKRRAQRENARTDERRPSLSLQDHPNPQLFELLTKYVREQVNDYNNRCGQNELDIESSKDGRAITVRRTIDLQGTTKEVKPPLTFGYTPDQPSMLCVCGITRQSYSIKTRSFDDGMGQASSMETVAERWLKIFEDSLPVARPEPQRRRNEFPGQGSAATGY